MGQTKEFAVSLLIVQQVASRLGCQGVFDMRKIPYVLTTNLARCDFLDGRVVVSGRRVYGI
jgi:hypothetical protein